MHFTKLLLIFTLCLINLHLIVGKDPLQTSTTLELNSTKDANVAKSRKVNLVDVYDIAPKNVTENKATDNSIVSKNSTVHNEEPHGLRVAENIYLNVTTNASQLKSTNQTNISIPANTNGLNGSSAILEETNKTVTSTKLGNNVTNLVNDKSIGQVNHTISNDNANNGNNTKSTNTTSPVTSNSSSTMIKPQNVTTTKSPNTDIHKTNATSPLPSTNSTSTTTTTTTTTTTSTTTTTTTTTTTPKPKKPKVTYGVEDFPDLDKENPAWRNLTQQTSSNKLPLPEVPYAQPSQEEFNSHGGRDYILPIVSMIFIIPLAIGVLITTYRRFRDCWSTRHYRRMDFLVDGMYND
ncbi:uncharacterized protein LOC142228784 [Haematobia irritans]|uniref:uncharacterized protein LOC142228784 n=1 Tax=Haematobia irritans TaxID=7368 RepID=UPI003F505CCE